MAKYELTLTRLISDHVKKRLLFNCISPNLKEMLSESYEEEEDEQRLEFMGNRGLLAKLRTHMLSVVKRIYKFQIIKQNSGEHCTVWWEKKAAMATLCKLDTVSRQDIFILQLIQGVYDANLKKTLLNKIDEDLCGLVRLACTRSNAKELIIDIDKNIVARHPT